MIASRVAPVSPRSAHRAGHDYGGTAEPSWRHVDWPAQLRRGSFAGAEVNYVDIAPSDPRSAERSPVLFIHGLGGQWQNWIQNIPRLAQERRVIAPDLPGFGLSPMPAERISISGYARMLEAMCEQLGLGSLALVGNSMGGFIGAEMAIRFPARAERLLLLSAAGITTANMFRTPVVTMARAAAALTAYTAARHRQMAMRPIARHMALALVARYPSRLASDLAWEGMIKGAGKPGFESALRACLEYDFRERLPDIACPTLIVWGEDDAILPARDAQEFERLIPDARKLLMRETGHVPQLERPGAFNDALLGFLGETGPAEELERSPGESQVA